MERRDFVKKGTLAAAALAAGMGALEAKANMHGHGDIKGKPRPANPQMEAVAKAAGECVSVGEACISHCHYEMGMKGNTDLARCLSEVSNMVAVTRAMGTVAALRTADKKEIKLLAKACIAYCESCKKECDRHAGHHEECKACAEACKRCIEACQKIA